MERKNEESYFLLFDAIYKKFGNSYNGPDYFSTDFEIAALSTFQKVFINFQYLTCILTH